MVKFLFDIASNRNKNVLKNKKMFMFWYYLTQMTDTNVDALESWFYSKNADFEQNQRFEPNRAKKQITCI